MVDYIALQVPVLAMVPMTSEARTELIKAGIGIFIDTPQQGVTVIKQVFSEKFSNDGKQRILPPLLGIATNKIFH